jgi:hypothetical protein
MTKLHNNKRRNQKKSRIAQENKPRTNEYYNALINTTLYDSRLGSEEAHESRHKARLQVLHSENTPTHIAQEAAKDLRLHGRSLVTRRVTPLITSIPSFQKVSDYDEGIFLLTCCNCLLIDLICLEKCKE